MFCRKCGSEIIDGQEFCPKCGSKVSVTADGTPASGPVGYTPQNAAYNGQNAANPGNEEKSGKGLIIFLVCIAVALLCALIGAIILLGNDHSGKKEDDTVKTEKTEDGDDDPEDDPEEEPDDKPSENGREDKWSGDLSDLTPDAEEKNPDSHYKLLIYDNAGLLSKSEISDLSDDMYDITEYGNVAFVSTDEKKYRDGMKYCAFVYEDLFGEEDGTIFVIDMEDRELWIYSWGSVYEVITESDANNITANISELATDGNYYECASDGFEQIFSRLDEEREYAEFISNVCADTAIEAYIDYYDEKFGFSNQDGYFSNSTVYCIYLNDDKIPELIIDGGDAASGAFILTYGPHGVDECLLARGEFEYWEKENVLNNCYGHMGVYGDSIISIKNGRFDFVSEGWYEIKEEYYESSWDEDYMWECYWEDEEVPYSEYMKIRDSYLPSKDGKWNDAYYSGIYVYGSYAFYDAYHNLQINWGEANYEDFYGYGMEKPNIYIYPDFSTQKTTVKDGKRVVETDVTLSINNGLLTASWPEAVSKEDEYSWHVYAGEDGTVYDGMGNEYSYLFWEGNSDWEPDFSEGFCVKGEDTAEFLRNALSEMGLTPREYNEFIVYWAPRMQSNEYNLISFQGLEYTNACPLTIKDSEGNAPDSMLRVMMAWKPADSKVTIKAQTFAPFDRTGFTVVEWGGRECR